MPEEHKTTPASAAGDGAPEVWSWAKVRDAFRRDWEQTKANYSSQEGQRLNQSAGDTLHQALGWQPPASPGHG